MEADFQIDPDGAHGAGKAVNMEKKISWKQLGKSNWLILLLAGVLLVIITLPTEKKDNKSEAPRVETASAETQKWEGYRENVEKQLEEMLQQIEGVGKVRVMVTLAATAEIVVEKDIPQTQSEVEEGDSNGGSRTTKENTWEEATVYEQRDGDSIPYVIKELVPDIEGVCVICEGGGNGTVAKNISEAVQALFPIEVHKIKVMKMK